MSYVDLINYTQFIFLFYFVILNGGYIMLMTVSMFAILRYMQTEEILFYQKAYSRMELPISILVPAYNEEETICGSVNSLLQLDYPEFEVVVINDGSSDNTLEKLIKEFSLKVFPEAYRVRIQTKQVRTIYHSTRYPNLRVIDKENGGKADSLNAGINCARFPLFCGMDADSVLQRDSLYRIVRPFLDNPTTIACGGTVRIINGCEIKDGHMQKIGLPKHPLALLQIMEYLRAFLFGRVGWSPFNALLIISGAFGLFKKEVVIKAGGYRADTVGEDMELVVRLHHLMRAEGKPYRITFIPDPICWTEAPESLRILYRQRIRWQRGLAESLFMNMGLLFHRRGGAAGWLAFPFMLFFECIGPFVEAASYLFFGLGFLFGYVSATAAITFLGVAVGFGILLSVSALLLEEFSFHIYPRSRHTFFLALAAIGENFGYRQLNSMWRFMGMIQWFFKMKGHWGEMKRTAKWNR